MMKKKRKLSHLIWIIFFVITALPTPILAQQQQEQQDQKDEGIDDILSGFEDMATIEPEPAEEEPEEPSWWALDGFLRFDSSYNYSHDSPETGQPDYRGLSKLRTTLQLELPLNLPRNWKAFFSGQAFYDLAYQLKDRDDFSDPLLDLYEDQAELREAYISGSPTSRLDVKLGRQIVVWGFADYTRVIDVLNPLDNREPGLVDIEDLRLPLAMSRIDYSFKNWRLTGVAVHEIDFNKDPVFNSDFFPSNQSLPNEITPSSDIENTELGVSLMGNFSGWDIGFYWAQVYNDTANFNTSGQTIELRHSRLNMGGVAVNAAMGNWLWKAESAWLHGFKFFNLPGDSRSRLDVMGGFEYSGITDATIAVEIVNRHLIDFDPELELSPDNAQENLTQYLVTYRADFLRDRLHPVALISFIGSKFDRGVLHRYSVGYDIFDAFTITGGLLIFHGGKAGSLIDAYKNNDRFFIEAKYNF